MGLFPEIIAGYEAAKELLEGTGVRLKDPGVMPVFSHDPLTMFASFPPAYSVEAVVLPGGINMVYNGRFGFADSRYEMLDYPTAHDAPDFKEKLKAVLMPKVEEFLAHAAKDKAQKHAENPGGIHESYEAIREIK
jgi:hypothetical protein